MRVAFSSLGVLLIAVVLGTFAAGVAGCGGGSGGGGSGGDDAGGVVGPDMAFLSACGHPGDTGNSKGVGKFCLTSDDCAGLEAYLCSSLNNERVPPEQKTYACVKPFCATEDVNAYCGENAVCLRNELGSACTPSECTPK